MIGAAVPADLRCDRIHQIVDANVMAKRTLFSPSQHESLYIGRTEEMATYVMMALTAVLAATEPSFRPLLLLLPPLPRDRRGSKSPARPRGAGEVSRLELYGQ